MQNLEVAAVLVGVVDEEANVGDGADCADTDGNEDVLAVLPVIAQVGEEQQHQRRHKHQLGRAVAVEHQAGQHGRGQQIARVDVAIHQIAVGKTSVEGGGLHHLEGGAGVQEPDGRDGQQEHARPGKAVFEDIAQRQADAQRGQQRDDDADAARHPDRARQPGRQHLQIDRGAQVVLPAVDKIGGQNLIEIAFQALVEKIIGEDGLHGLIGKEVDREAIQADEARDQIDEHCRQQQPQGGVTRQGKAAARGLNGRSFDGCGFGRGSVHSKSCAGWGIWG